MKNVLDAKAHINIGFDKFDQLRHDFAKHLNECGHVFNQDLRCRYCDSSWYDLVLTKAFGDCSHKFTKLIEDAISRHSAGVE